MGVWVGKWSGLGRVGSWSGRGRLELDRAPSGRAVSDSRSGRVSRVGTRLLVVFLESSSRPLRVQKEVGTSDCRHTKGGGMAWGGQEEGGEGFCVGPWSGLGCVGSGFGLVVTGSCWVGLRRVGPCRARGRDGSLGSPCSHPRLLPHRGGHSESPIVFIFRRWGIV